MAKKYQKRLQAWVRVEVLEHRSDEQVLKYFSGPQQKSVAKIVSLDERGKMWSSPQLADFIRNERDCGGVRTLNFLVGSPYGLSEDLRKICAFSWSLSPAVFPSDLAWVLANEQIYRAFSIINGSPYHHA